MALEIQGSFGWWNKLSEDQKSDIRSLPAILGVLTLIVGVGLILAGIHGTNALSYAGVAAIGGGTAAIAGSFIWSMWNVPADGELWQEDRFGRNPVYV